MGGLVAGDELGGGGDGGGAVGGGGGVAAVVEDDIGSLPEAVEAVNFIDEAAGDGVGGGIFPVGGHGVPENGDQAKAAGDAQRLRAAGSEGRTKETDRRAGDLGQSIAGAGKLIFDAASRGEGEVEVRPGMVADRSEEHTSEIPSTRHLV